MIPILMAVCDATNCITVVNPIPQKYPASGIDNNAYNDIVKLEFFKNTNPREDEKISENHKVLAYLADKHSVSTNWMDCRRLVDEASSEDVPIYTQPGQKRSYARKHMLTTGSRLTKRPIGTILLDGDFISKADLERALMVQVERNQQLGEILMALGLLDQKDLTAILSVQKDFADPQQTIRAAAGVRMLLGDLALQSKKITVEQLDRALMEQQQTGERLGEIFIRMGLLEPREVSAFIAFQKYQSGEIPSSGRLRLGELLVTTGQITRSQLDDALAHQKQTGGKLGELLVHAGYVKRTSVDQGLRLQSKLITAALAALLTMAVFLGAPEAQASTPAQTVVLPGIQTETEGLAPKTSMIVLHQEPELVVTYRDWKRGYVESFSATKIEISTHNRSGYLLIFEGLNGQTKLFSEAYVMGFGGEVQISGNGGWVLQPYASEPVALQLSYRFILTEATHPGTYVWPLLVSTRSL